MNNTVVDLAPSPSRFSIKKLWLAILMLSVVCFLVWAGINIYIKKTATVLEIYPTNTLFSYPPGLRMPVNTIFPLSLNIDKAGMVQVSMKVSPADAPLEIMVRGTSFSTTSTGEIRRLSFPVVPGKYSLVFTNGPQEITIEGSVILTPLE